MPLRRPYALFYSVAQHSVIVSELVEQRGGDAEDVFAALMHDAAEAYLGDMPHPVKHRSPLGEAFKAAEEHLEQVLREHFRIKPGVPEIKRADRALLATERRAFSTEGWHWPELDGVGGAGPRADGVAARRGRPPRSRPATRSSRRDASSRAATPTLGRVPEGDTIHHAANRIRPVLEGRVPDELATPQPRYARDRWPERLAGRAVTRVDAHGKHLFLRFEGELVLHSHLRMTGAWGVTRDARWRRGRAAPWLVLRRASTRSCSSTGRCWS